MAKDSDTLHSRQDFERAFGMYYSNLVVFIVKYVGDIEIARDIVQEMFCNLWDKRDRIAISSNLGAFLLRSARNALINHLQRGREAAVELSDDLKSETTFEEELHVMSRNVLLLKIIETLPEQRKRIFRMFYFEENSYAEIAEKLNISKNTVKTQMGRALSDLRVFIKNRDLE